METAIVLFTRDLRVRDSPALAMACARARQVVPLFVIDPGLTVPPNRATFLAESVAVLRDELRERGGDLLIRRGEPVSEVIRLAQETAAEALNRYGEGRDDLAADETSRLSAYLRFGCVSPLELARAALPRPGGGSSAGSWPGVISSTKSPPRSRTSLGPTTGQARGPHAGPGPPTEALDAWRDGADGHPGRGRGHAAARRRGVHA